MNNTKSDPGEALWDQLVGSYRAYLGTSRSFFRSDIDRVTLMREKFRGQDVDVAIVMSPNLSVEERKELFVDLLSLAIKTQGLIGHVREAIWSLPKDWLIANIGRFAEPILVAGAESEYRRLLELYDGVDAGLTR
jgi:hypothetical protein